MHDLCATERMPCIESGAAQLAFPACGDGPAILLLHAGVTDRCSRHRSSNTWGGYRNIVAVDPARRILASDQLHVDLDLSEDNLRARARLALGTSVIEVTPEPHRGCAKFVEPGTVRPGDEIRKVP